MNNNRYIHFGSNHYDKQRLERAVTSDKKYRRLDKPNGLWASPIDAKYGWKEWCENEEFRLEGLEESFEFTLSPEAKILRIEKLSDATDYFIADRRIDYANTLITTVYSLNLPLIYDRYDAMEVILSNDWQTFHDINIFYTWDVDSICVWNPDIIVKVKE